LIIEWSHLPGEILSCALPIRLPLSAMILKGEKLANVRDYPEAMAAALPRSAILGSVEGVPQPGFWHPKF
jgi:hypothetical protein